VIFFLEKLHVHFLNNTFLKMERQQNSTRTDTFYKDIYTAVCHQMVNPKNRIWSEEAGDIAGDILLQFGEKGEKENIKHIGAYISGVLRFKKYAEQRRLKRLTPLDVSDADNQDYRDDNDPLHVLLSDEHAAQCMKMVALIKGHLDKNTFEMLQLWSDGNSYDRIADAVGCDSRRVKNVIYRTRLKIKEWRDEGVFKIYDVF
jgi:DNA-directed RNA polymerase specialized sigma24 family protein